MITKKTILVTGAAGFVGSNLVRNFLKFNYDIHIILKKTTNCWRLKDILPKLTPHHIELHDRESLRKLMKKIQPFAIFHLAAHGAYSNQTDAGEMISTNILGTYNLLETSKDIPYKIFVNTGSSSEYGFKEKPMKETDTLEPVSFYAATKASAALLCHAFAKNYKKPVVTFRLFSVYGPYEEKGRFMPTIINNAINSIPIKITPGEQRRDFIYIEDIVQAFIQTLKKGDKLSGKICNIGTGKEYTNDEVVNTLFKIINKNVSVEKGAFPKRSWDTNHWCADISQSKKLLEWKPKYNLENGLRKFFKWFLIKRQLYDEN